MHDLQHFSLRDMTDLGAALRSAAQDAGSMEEAAGRIVGHLRTSLVVAPTGSPACVLARLYKTHLYRDLDPELQAFARRAAAGALLPENLRCLTLLATAGDRPEWCSRAASKGHRAIPLLSEAMVRAVPMVSRLLHQFGLEVREMLAPDPAFLRQKGQATCNVFYVPEARGSEYIPAQEDFVVPAGVRSVLGFGGILPSGSLFAVILFCRVPVPEATADQFKTLALNVKLALLPHDAGRVFAP